MKLIINPTELTNQFMVLLDKYPSYYFATAWAGVPKNVFEKLLKNSSRIKQMVVGIHFYQSDPAFFKEFINSKTVRTVLQPDGTYHPKVFLFYETDQRWTLLVGSGNFTDAAFTKNTEVVMMIDASEATPDILRKAKKTINDNWNIGKIVDDNFCQAYTLQWAKMRTRRKELAGTIDKYNILNDGVTAFMRSSWDAYVSRFNDHRDTVNTRFEMLETIRGIFASGRSLIDMSEDERRLISGNPNKLFLPGADRYADFGTSGSGKFMNKMIEGNTYISNALDKISLVGDITEENFNDFLNIFLQEPDATTGWVSSAARLLAMKRPDVFYNITKANREKFCDDFGNAQSHTKNLNNYWHLVVQKVQLSTWYNNAEPKNKFERRLRETRAAMLDVLYYFD